jgi:hypothetical protein
VNRALPDADPDAFVEALATGIATFDKWAIANTKRLVNTKLPPDVEIGAGWDACIASLGRTAAQDGIKAPMHADSKSRGMSKIGSDTTWAKSRANQKKRPRRSRRGRPPSAHLAELVTTGSVGDFCLLLDIHFLLRVRKLFRKNLSCDACPSFLSG